MKFNRKESKRKRTLKLYRHFDSKGILIISTGGKYGIEVNGKQIPETFKTESKAFKKAEEIESNE